MRVLFRDVQLGMSFCLLENSLSSVQSKEKAKEGKSD